MRSLIPVGSLARSLGASGLALAALASFGLAGILVGVPVSSSWAQGVDCARLQQQIAASGNGGGDRLASAARKQNIELQRTSAYAHQLGCDRQQFLFFGGSTAPQCGGLNARIAQMQANLGQLQAGAGGGGGRSDLVARYNAYCRGGQQTAALQQPRQRGFFESLFGGAEEQRQVPPADMPVDPNQRGLDDGDGEGGSARGGSQAVCVRTCDGGFFPMAQSARHNQDSLNEMCTALCPGTQVAVYTRNPNNEIRSAVSLDGSPYMDLPNALKFEKNFDAACTCRPAGKTWAEALVGAEGALGNQRKGDIIVTPEKSAELSRPKMDSKTRSSLLKMPTPLDTAQANAALDSTKSSAASATDQGTDVVGPDGIKRHVRKVGPQL